VQVLGQVDCPRSARRPSSFSKRASQAVLLHPTSAELRGFFPLPSRGLHPKSYCSMNRRMRATVTSQASSENGAISSGNPWFDFSQSDRWQPSSQLRMKSPPGTTGERQQSRFGPHLLASPLQLGGVTQPPTSSRHAAVQSFRGSSRPSLHT